MTKKKTEEKKAPKEPEKPDPKDQKIEELTDHLKRTLAEFDNFKKRLDKENCARMKFSAKDIILKILPVVDNLDLAVKNSDNHEELVKGVKLIQQQIQGILEQEGVKRIKTEDQSFDPNMHEALMMGDGEPGKILQEFQAGYTFHDSVLRHSKVKVGKTDEDNEADKEGGAGESEQ
jgi:molecular chaperone GrpE